MTRERNIWFRPVSCGNRKSCPTCKQKLPKGEHIWSWGEYHHARWHTIAHFCYHCFVNQARPLLVNMEQVAGPLSYNFRGASRPKWLHLSCLTCQTPALLDRDGVCKWCNEENIVDSEYGINYGIKDGLEVICLSPKLWDGGADPLYPLPSEN